MKGLTGSSHQGVLYLASGLAFVSVLLRSLLVYRSDPLLLPVLTLLSAWLILFVGETLILHRRPGLSPWHFAIYLVLQIALTLVPLFLSNSSDYIAILFCILSMQVMQWSSPRVGAVVVALFSPLSAWPLIRIFGPANGIAFTMIFAGANSLVAFYALATRRSQMARAQNEALARQLLEANRQLQTLSARREQLAVTRERQRLARELHDSVTQTIFSMTLTTQSAALLLERDPTRVGAQLARLTDLAQKALSEMRVLIAELHPGGAGEGALVAGLRRHLQERKLPDDISVTVEAQGSQLLSATEEQNLFRIAQEAVNNIVKHADASHACIRLHLDEPCWLEIEDNGRGFDLEQAQNGGRLGLSNMRERAVEIGWGLRILTRPGAGTRIRVEKPYGERRAG